MLTRLERLLNQASYYQFNEQPIPLTLESAIAAEGGSLETLHDNSEDTNNHG